MSLRVEEIEQWIRSNLEAFLRDAGAYELLEDLSQSHPQLYKSAENLLNTISHYCNDEGATTPFGVVALIAFLYFSGSIVWHWSSPSVRWAYRQYLHTSRKPPSSSSGAGGGGVGPLYILYLIQNSFLAALRTWNRLVVSAAYHLPPVAVALLLLAPYSRIYYSNDPSIMGNEHAAAMKKEHEKHLNWAARYVLDELSTRCFKWVSILVAISWLHEFIIRKRRLSDLPLPPEYRDLDRSLLPPFLPEEDDDADEESREAVYREAVMEYLVSLQEVRGKSQDAHTNGADHHSQNHHGRHLSNARSAVAGDDHDDETVGYAVVTGASRGIGRALAVELARYGFPLVLVARDRARLLLLAKDLRDCYGTHCCIVAYDLAAAPNAAEQVYKLIVEKAGLKVDVLVNNAGIAQRGVSVDLPNDEVDRMITLNVQAVAALTHRFGKDMKDRGRGRIMIVSSLNSMAVGIRSVAVYSATKAFERSFCNSLSLDLEPYGVGVTCLVPGAVRDTEFRTRSCSEQALVWSLPFCTCTSQQVAAQGVRAMLRGEAEVIVGLLNRFFAKVLQPLLPQRLHNLVATIMWNSFYVPFLSSHPPANEPQTKNRQVVAVDPRLARACRESDVFILTEEGWQAERGWKTDTGRFEGSTPDVPSPSPVQPPR